MIKGYFTTFLNNLFQQHNDSEPKEGEFLFIDQNDNYKIRLSDMEMEKHVLLMGEHGSGKSNVISLFLQQLDDDAHAIIFDPKGDYYKDFFMRSRDIVLGSSNSYRLNTVYWNIFREIEFSSPYRDGKKQTLKEIVTLLFEGRSNGVQPFFSNAAKDVLAIILQHKLQVLWNDPKYIELQNMIEQPSVTQDKLNILFNEEKKIFDKYVSTDLNNSELSKIILNWDIDRYRNELIPEYPVIGTYLGNSGEYHTGLSVISELKAMYFEVFQYTIFEKYVPGKDFSIAEYIMDGKGKLFIEYDLANSSALGPMYAILIDSAFKIQLEAFKRNGKKCYFILDELKLIPYCAHFQDAINAGRSLGVRIIVGIQSIGQLIEVYGESLTNAILNGLSTVFCFNVSGEDDSRKRFIERIGVHGAVLSTKVQNKDLYRIRETDIIQLKCGQAIIKLPNKLYPILFCFEKYVEKENDFEKRIDDSINALLSDMDI